ncbi:hypothetical protein DWX10_22375 [Clostridium sp. AF18-27]|uniref:hypothetical protein n=1 Tax=Enterocloster lavalensis TaxID=460384 RepID=UPI000E4DA803|nr:hypothetical protein [Enterocloster lavalensis]MBS5604675.1 hypothetical protein [Enterocloster asparagiformis]MCB6343959.1 hypothetical protein [Enterocloster lavalensis]RHR49092.1 hypothetical protein DWX10_22375 [Clostridium sp. AF18-27]
MEQLIVTILKIPCGIIKKLVWFAAKVAMVFGAILAVIYWLNLDMKLVWKLKPHLDKHYDEMERDVNL